jgi:hypothetical protein
MALQMALLGPANDTKIGTANGTANDTATIKMIHFLNRSVSEDSFGPEEVAQW